MNFCCLVGNVGKDPEIRSTQKGSKVANFSLATTERFKTDDGERKEKTTWHDCVAWGSLAKTVEDYVHKGDKLVVIGQVEKRVWEDREGKRRVQMEIKVDRLELASGGGRPRDHDDDEDEKPRYQRKSSTPKRGTEIPDDLDDEIPF